MDLLYLSDHQTRLRPQAGTPCTLSWSQFADWLSVPVWGKDKTQAGGYSPAKYNENIRHLDRLEHVCALVFDVDVGGEIDRVAKAVAAYSCVVHETFSSTEATKRCRLLVEINGSINGLTYSAVHKKFRQSLVALHVHPDEHATDASRLSYFPVRLPGTGYDFAKTDGKALDAETLSRAHWPKQADRITTAGTSEGAAANVTPLYRDSAILNAQFNIENAPEGARHRTLLKEANSLSRVELGLSFEQVEEALFETALARMGQGRAHEVRAAIRDSWARMRRRS